MTGEPQRIAFAGDWHGNADHATLAIAYAKEQGAEIIVHVGDFAYQFTIEFLAAVDSSLRRTGLELWFVEGNHDNPRKLQKRPGPDGLRYVTKHIRHIPRGQRWTWGDVSFLGCGGAHSVDRPWRTAGVSWWKEEAITEADVSRCVDGGPVDVLIAHDCPAGVIVPGIDDRLGPPPFPAEEITRANEHRAMLRRIVDGCWPRLIVHGHYHVAYFKPANFGYGLVPVIGLDMDGADLARNVTLFDLDDLRAVVRG